MATILTPSIRYNVDRCPTGEVVQRTDPENPTSHPKNFNDYPDYFYYELFQDTRTEGNVLSDNNPVPLYLTDTMD